MGAGRQRAGDDRLSSLDVQGRVVVQDYRQVRSDGAEFSAHGVFMIIADDSRIGWWLFDSYGQPPEPGDRSLAR